MYATIQDAKVVFQNSGVFEWFDLEQEQEVIEWMYHNDKTPAEAADHFGVS